MRWARNTSGTARWHIVTTKPNRSRGSLRYDQRYIDLGWVRTLCNQWFEPDPTGLLRGTPCPRCLKVYARIAADAAAIGCELRPPIEVPRDPIKETTT